MDGSRPPMDGRKLVATLGGVRALGLWGGALPVLSAGFLEPGRSFGSVLAMEDGVGRLRLGGADRFRLLDVSAGSALVEPSRRNLCRGPVRGESLLPRDCVLAQCAGGTAGGMLVTLTAAVRVASGRRWAKGGSAAQPDCGRSVVDECSIRRDGELLTGFVDRDRGDCAPQAGFPSLRRRGRGAGRGFGKPLRDSRGLRGEMGEYHPGAGSGTAPAG